MSDPNFRDYLHRLYSTGLRPNFWTSEEWARVCHWTVVREHSALSVYDIDGVPVLPALFDKDPSFPVLMSQQHPFYGYADMGDRFGGQVLDLEFIYSPGNFSDLSGRQWRTVRKNMAEFREDAREEVQLLPAREVNMETFWDQWVEERQGAELYDPDAMVEYLMSTYHRLALVGTSGHVYALLAFDFNRVFTNFRYCETVGAEHLRGISDTARVLFYQYLQWSGYTGPVNDGGALGRSGLEQYKRRLHPAEINTIRSYQ